MPGEVADDRKAVKARVLLLDREKLLLHLRFVSRNHADVEAVIGQLMAELESDSIGTASHNCIAVVVLSAILCTQVLSAPAAVFEAHYDERYKRPDYLDRTNDGHKVEKPSVPSCLFGTVIR